MPASTSSPCWPSQAAVTDGRCAKGQGSRPVGNFDRVISTHGKDFQPAIAPVRRVIGRSDKPVPQTDLIDVFALTCLVPRAHRPA